MALIDLVSEAYVTQNIINLSSTSQLGQQLRVTGGGYGGAGPGTFVVGANQPHHQHHHQLITDGGGNLVQLINPIPANNAPGSGLVLNYVVDQNGSQIPIYDTLPLVTGSGDGSYFTLMSAEPEVEEVTSEPETPSHILDHMYAKKQKEPGSGPTRKRKKRSRKKEPPAIQAAPEYVDILPNVSQTNTTKINIIRKGFAASITNPASFRPVLSPRPNILQNTRGSSSNVTVTATAITSTSIPTTIATHPSKPPIVIPISSKSKSTKPTAGRSSPRKAASSQSQSATTTSVFLISSDGSNGPDELLQEDCFRQVDSTKEGELCFMLTSSSDLSKTDTNEAVMMATDGDGVQEPQETDSLLSEFSICSFPDDQQLPGGAGTFLLDDKQIFLSYD